MPQIRQPRFDAQGRTLCARFLCDRPTYLNLYIYCLEHYDRVRARGEDVPRLDGTAAPVRPTGDIQLRRHPMGGYFCLHEGCNEPTYREYAYCQPHSIEMVNAGRFIPYLGQGPAVEPVIVNQYIWSAHGANQRGQALWSFEGDCEKLKEVLAFDGGNYRGVTQVVRYLRKAVYHKKNGRIRGPQSYSDALILPDFTLQKKFTDGMKTPKRYRKELADAIASGAKIGGPVQPSLNYTPAATTTTPIAVQGDGPYQAINYSGASLSTAGIAIDIRNGAYVWRQDAAQQQRLAALTMSDLMREYSMASGGLAAQESNEDE